MENPRDAGLLFQVAQLFATACIPQKVLAALRVGRLTALQKPNGSVRGIVAGDAFRRLVARTMAQQLGPAIERATSPFQYALSPERIASCHSGFDRPRPHCNRVVHRRHWGFRRGVRRCCKGFSQWLEGMQQCHLCGSSTSHLQVICGKTMMAWSTLSYKQKAVNSVTH